MSMSTDYADFRYQHIDAQTLIVEGTNPANETNPRVADQFAIDPLQSRGGLSNNEVAELVYLEVYASLEFETESGDQNVASSAELRGVVGANLSASEGDFVAANPNVDGERISERGAGGNSQASTITDSGKFQMYRVTGSTPFDDQTNGPGGAGSTTDFHAEKYYRSLTGRGPVLDQTDELTINQILIVDDTVIDVFGNARVSCVWDIAEVDSAGREFSLPDV